MASRGNGTTRSPRRSGTRRAAILAVVVCALGLTVAVPLRTYLGQRAEIASQLHQREELRTELARLKDRKEELSDPVQIQAEARKRLRYVMPGETPYVVQLPRDQVEPGTRSSAPDKPDHNRQSWYAGLWRGVSKGG